MGLPELQSEAIKQLADYSDKIIPATETVIKD